MSLTILVIDDDRPVRVMLGRLLEPYGFRVSLAGSAAAARGLLDTDAPDLVVTDVVMPGESGIELRRYLAEYRPGLTVILMSGFSSEEPARVADEVPNTYFLQKPFPPAALIDLVLGALGSQRDEIAPAG